MLEINSGWNMAFSYYETPEFPISGSFHQKREGGGEPIKSTRGQGTRAKRKPSNFQNLLFILNRASPRDAINLYFIGRTGV